MKCRVRAIIKQDDTLLLVKHKGPDGLPYDTWVLPGGGVEDGELLIPALEREMLEETGIRAQVGDLLYVHQFERGGVAEGPEFFFAIKNPADFTDIDLTKSSHGQQEISDIGFYDPRTLNGVLPEFLRDIEAIYVNGPIQFKTITGDSYA